MLSAAACCCCLLLLLVAASCCCCLLLLLVVAACCYCGLLLLAAAGCCPWWFAPNHAAGECFGASARTAGMTNPSAARGVAGPRREHLHSACTARAGFWRGGCLRCFFFVQVDHASVRETIRDTLGIVGQAHGTSQFLPQVMRWPSG